MQTVLMEGGLHLAIFKDETKSSGDRFKWTKGICRISDPAEEQLGRGRHGRLPVRFVLVFGALFAFARSKIFLDRIGNRRSHHIRRRNDQGRKDGEGFVRSPSGFPLSIDGVDVDGSTWTTFLLSPSFPLLLGLLSTTSSVSRCRREL